MSRTHRAATGALAFLLLAGCASASRGTLSPAPPTELKAACGHPGVVVHLKTVPVVVPRSACDLTGVVVTYGGIGVTVPATGGASAQGDGAKGAASLTASFDATTQDVTIHS